MQKWLWVDGWRNIWLSLSSKRRVNGIMWNDTMKRERKHEREIAKVLSNCPQKTLLPNATSRHTTRFPSSRTLDWDTALLLGETIFLRKRILQEWIPSILMLPTQSYDIGWWLLHPCIPPFIDLFFSIQSSVHRFRRSKQEDTLTVCLFYFHLCYVYRVVMQSEVPSIHLSISLHDSNKKREKERTRGLSLFSAHTCLILLLLLVLVGKTAFPHARETALDLGRRFLALCTGTTRLDGLTGPHAHKGIRRRLFLAFQRLHDGRVRPTPRRQFLYRIQFLHQAFTVFLRARFWYQNEWQKERDI